MFFRSQSSKSAPLGIVGSSVYGRYAKIDVQHTYNLFMSDQALVPYPGYMIGAQSSQFGNAASGRALYSSDKLGVIIGVFDDRVYEITLTYNQANEQITSFNATLLGQLQTSVGKVYIAENNKPQILISDNSALYLYDPSLTKFTVSFTGSASGDTITLASGLPRVLQQGELITVSAGSGGVLPAGLTANTNYYVILPSASVPPNTYQLASSPEDADSGTFVTITSLGTAPITLTTGGPFQIPAINFQPGYITFHDTYFIAAASNDNTFAPPANNTWRISGQNNGLLWPTTLNGVSYVGTLETKPDNTRAVLRFPSRGNMIYVMGNDVTESWFDTGAQLFPYQRSINSNIDYGCVSPATVTYLDELCVWLAKNEKSGPIIMASTGGMPDKITTDGIDYEFSQLQNPQDSEAFLYRQDGHLIYHLNFYSDNKSYFYDFNTKKIYNACDQNLNYYAMSSVCFYKNQYFAISKDNGNFFIFDTTFYVYNNVYPDGTQYTAEIPRIRQCPHLRLPSQNYVVVTDLGFTTESGQTSYQVPPGNSTPKVMMSMSYDGGNSFSSTFEYHLPGPGIGKNKILFWQLGAGNDMVPQFQFVGFGRFVILEGEINFKE